VHGEFQKTLDGYINKLSQAMINDLKDMKMFTPIILNVLYSTCIVLKMKPTTDDVRKMLKMPNLMDKLKRVKPSEIDHNQHLLLDKFIHKKEFDVM
jgi:hypothetical protein